MGKNCPDCGVEPGQPHHAGCDLERCPECGFQALSCDHGDLPESHRRLPWDGEYPGLADARRHGLWCRWVPGAGWLPCDKEEPGAVEDLNRLVRLCDWNPETKSWEKRK